LGNVHLEDLDGDRKITLGWILGRWVVSMGSGWN